MPINITLHRIRSNQFLFKKLFQVEIVKLSTRINGLYITGFFLLVLLQIIFLVPLDVSHPPEVYKSGNRYIDNFAFTIIPILYIVSVATEFENYIAHRFLFSGLSRQQYFLCKLISCAFYSALALLLIMLCNSILSIIYKIPFQLKVSDLIKYFFITFYICSITLVFCFLTKRTSYSIVIFVLYVLIEGIMAGSVVPGGDNFLPYSAALKIIRESFNWFNGFVILAYQSIIICGCYKLCRSGDFK